jgi:hypothetical protein
MTNGTLPRIVVPRQLFLQFKNEIQSWERETGIQVYVDEPMPKMPSIYRGEPRNRQERRAMKKQQRQR